MDLVFRFSFMEFLGDLILKYTEGHADSRQAANDEDDERLRRKFISERLEASPDAFSSEYDVTAAMTYFSRAF